MITEKYDTSCNILISDCSHTFTRFLAFVDGTASKVGCRLFLLIRMNHTRYAYLYVWCVEKTAVYP